MATRHQQLTEELQERACLFAAGALPENERMEYIRHLEEDNCAICLHEVREFEATAAMLTLELPLETPSASVQERLMSQARAAASPQQRRNAPRRRFSREWAWGILAVGASALLLIVLNNNIQLRRLADSLNSRITALEAQISEQRIRLAALTSPEVRVVNLAGQGPNSSASGRIFWDRSRRRWFFHAEQLPQLGADRTYQLWFVPSTGNPVSAVVFNTDAGGSAQIEVPVPDSIDQLKAAAVTTEPVGGLPQPTGAFDLLGAIE